MTRLFKLINTHSFLSFNKRFSLDFAPQFINDQKLPPVSGATRTERADYRHLHAGSNPPTPTHQPHRTRRSQSRQPAKERKRSLSRPHSPSMDIDRDLPPLPTHISYDLRYILFLYINQR